MRVMEVRDHRDRPTTGRQQGGKRNEASGLKLKLQASAWYSEFQSTPQPSNVFPVRFKNALRYDTV